MARCPGELELARAVGGEADPAVGAHVASCTACRGTVDGFAHAIALARKLPLELPSRARREEVRTAVLAAGAGSLAPAHGPARGRRFAVAVAAAGVSLAAAAAVALYVATPARKAREVASAGEARGTVHARPGARFTASSRLPDEVVRLEDGVIDVQVDPLRRGERFRVVVGDAEIEVRGTAFEVAARADQLIWVEVRHGAVEVRPKLGAKTLLAAGQSWRVESARGAQPRRAESAPIEPPPRAPDLPRAAISSSGERARSPASAAVAPLPAPRRPAPSPPAITTPGAGVPPVQAEAPPAQAKASPPSPRAPEELAYDDAWAAMRAGNFTRAATAFTRVFILAPDGALAEDASFWHAVALARGDRRAEAITAFRDFLAMHAPSPRAGEASAMLGWLLLDTGRRDEAARRFQAASSDPSPTVRESARQGLDALARPAAPR